MTTFGESHGPAVGGVIDGCPSGINLDIEAIQKDLNRRKPGQSSIVTQRKEADEVEFFSGIFTTTGVLLGLLFLILTRNQGITTIKNQYRPSHADKVYDDKYGIRTRGEEVSRETASREWQVPSPNSSSVTSNLQLMFLQLVKFK